MKVITGKVRASYVNVFQARFNEMSGKEEYSMAIIIPKTEKETIQKIKDAAKAVAENKWGAKVPAGLRNPLRDADKEAEEKDEKVDPAYENSYFMNIKSKDAPEIIDAKRNPVIDSMEFISGDYCRVSMGAFAYDTKGNKGVSFGLNNIQVLGKGEPLGKSRAEDEFDEYKDESDNSADDLF